MLLSQDFLKPAQFAVHDPRHAIDEQDCRGISSLRSRIAPEIDVPMAGKIDARLPSFRNSELVYLVVKMEIDAGESELGTVQIQNLPALSQSYIVTELPFKAVQGKLRTEDAAKSPPYQHFAHYAKFAVPKMLQPEPRCEHNKHNYKTAISLMIESQQQ